LEDELIADGKAVALDQVRARLPQCDAPNLALVVHLVRRAVEWYRTHERLQRSIEQTINAGNYSWVTMRVDDRGRVRCS